MFFKRKKDKHVRVFVSALQGWGQSESEISLAIQHCHLLAVLVNRLPRVVLVNVDCGKIRCFILLWYPIVLCNSNCEKAHFSIIRETSTISINHIWSGIVQYIFLNHWTICTVCTKHVYLYQVNTATDSLCCSLINIFAFVHHWRDKLYMSRHNRGSIKMHAFMTVIYTVHASVLFGY